MKQGAKRGNTEIAGWFVSTGNLWECARNLNAFSQRKDYAIRGQYNAYHHTIRFSNSPASKQRYSWRLDGHWAKRNILQFLRTKLLFNCSLLYFSAIKTVRLDPNIPKTWIRIICNQCCGSGTFWTGRIRSGNDYISTGSWSRTCPFWIPYRICIIFTDFSSKWSNSSLITNIFPWEISKIL